MRASWDLKVQDTDNSNPFFRERLTRMHFDNEYELPQGPVEVAPDVQGTLDNAMKGLKRVSVVRYENGTEENVGGFTVTGVRDDFPQEPAGEILDATYRLAFMKSRELEREVQFKFKFTSHLRPKSPYSVTVAVIDPETHTGNENMTDAVIAELGSINPADAMAAIATRAASAANKMMERALQIIEGTNRELRDDLRAALNREHAVAQQLVNVHTADVGREERVYNVLDTAIAATVTNAQNHGEIARREMTLDLEMERFKLGVESNKESGTAAFFRDLGGQFKEAMPMLMTAAGAAMGGNPAIAAMAGQMGGPPPGPPPAPPRGRGLASASKAPRSGPMPPSTPSATQAAAPTPTPAANAPAPGAGVGMMSAAVGQSITSEQWKRLSDVLAPDELQSLRAWMSPVPRADEEIMGAMLLCGASANIVRAISVVATEEQGVRLFEILERMKSSESKAAESSPAPSVTQIAPAVTASPETASPSAPESETLEVSATDAESDSRVEDLESAALESKKRIADLEAQLAAGGKADAESDSGSADAESNGGKADAKSKARNSPGRKKSKAPVSKSTKKAAKTRSRR